MIPSLVVLPLMKLKENCIVGYLLNSTNVISYILNESLMYRRNFFFILIKVEIRLTCLIGPFSHFSLRVYPILLTFP